MEGLSNNMEDNGKKIQMAEDIATLKVEVREIRDRSKEQHDEIMEEFRKLRSKVNDEITLMQKTIFDNRKFILRLLWISLVVGSFIWIKESREWIISNIFRL